LAYCCRNDYIWNELTSWSLMRELNSPNRDRQILLPSQKNLGWEHHKN